MGFFDKLFGKKSVDIATDDTQKIKPISLEIDDQIIASNNEIMHKVIRNLTDVQRQKLEEATLLLQIDQLYTHYWTDDLQNSDKENPEWKNKVQFFWENEEPFPKKSLPPPFETFMHKYFFFKGDIADLLLQYGEVIPWFGMPGGGTKFFCIYKNEEHTVPELHELGFIQYVEKVELTKENLNILVDKENYRFYINSRIFKFKNGQLFMHDAPISFSDAYQIGAIDVVKYVK